MSFFSHKTAIIDKDCVIGNGTRIWHWTHISSGARIGNNCSLGQNVFVSGKARIGNNVRIQNNVSIYDCVIIGDDVFCGPSMVFTNIINPRAEISRRDQYMSTIVKQGATLGANCTIVCGNSIGEYAFIGAGSVVTGGVPPFALMAGNPAKHIGWMSRFGERLSLPLSGQGRDSCPHTGDVYILEKNSCSILNTSNK
ncbi:acyltransferase [Desulfopila inferna]|uniref:acyltransferase n=1 Tax=Desulfopila inferna TaxID=468528 RepID=UPI0019646058|nr:acetyltransferase [Desulfopila inferna]MBM9604070.1 N-acetyltransferase [Desulfopila inferna]